MLSSRSRHKPFVVTCFALYLRFPCSTLRRIQDHRSISNRLVCKVIGMNPPPPFLFVALFLSCVIFHLSVPKIQNFINVTFAII